MTAPSFLEHYLAGRVTAEQIDDFIGYWDNDPDPFGPRLHTFLGLTCEQYQQWRQTGELPGDVRCLGF